LSVAGSRSRVRSGLRTRCRTNRTRRAARRRWFRRSKEHDPASKGHDGLLIDRVGHYGAPGPARDAQPGGDVGVAAVLDEPDEAVVVRTLRSLGGHLPHRRAGRTAGARARRADREPRIPVEFSNRGFRMSWHRAGGKGLHSGVCESLSAFEARDPPDA
jgi:hypothetical protein